MVEGKDLIHKKVELTDGRKGVVVGLYSPISYAEKHYRYYVEFRNGDTTTNLGWVGIEEIAVIDEKVNNKVYSKYKYITAEEFREKGYLQEVNRRFLHPLGLALEVRKEIDGKDLFISGIQDHRDEGIYFDLNNSDEERLKRFRNKRDFIDSELKKRWVDRAELFESISYIEEIPEEKN